MLFSSVLSLLKLNGKFETVIDVSKTSLSIVGNIYIFVVAEGFGTLLYLLHLLG